MSSAGDGIRFFDLVSLRPLGGWKTSIIAEISSFLHDDKSYFLFGDNSYLYVLTEEVMLANSQSKIYSIQKDYHPLISTNSSMETSLAEITH